MIKYYTVKKVERGYLILSPDGKPFSRISKNVNQLKQEVAQIWKEQSWSIPKSLGFRCVKVEYRILDEGIDFDIIKKNIDRERKIISKLKLGVE